MVPFTEVLKVFRIKGLEKGQEFIVLNVCETSKRDVRKAVGSVGIKLRKEVWENINLGVFNL